jgi:hypothetical protein
MNVECHALKRGAGTRTNTKYRKYFIPVIRDAAHKNHITYRSFQGYEHIFVRYKKNIVYAEPEYPAQQAL